MAVVALKDGYTGEVRDRIENFHGNQLLYIGWDRHLMFGAPVCIPVPPDLPFGTLVDQILPGIYGKHSDWGKIDWQQVEWLCSGQPFTPQRDKSLAENGLGHKAVIRLCTPGLDGVKGSGT